MRGKGGHAASPHVANDPMALAAHLVLAVQNIVSRHLDPLESGVITLCTIQGGTATNVTPDEIKKDRLNMKLKLSQGGPQPSQAIERHVVEGHPLSAEISHALLAQLPPLEADTSQTSDFQFPEPLPVPLTGKTTETPFPPTDEPTTAPAVVADPLAVLRYAPEGDEVNAPFISVTFNQPMVPIGTTDATPDFEIEPPVAGEWCWINSTTAHFYYLGRDDKPLPRATAFTVTISAETRALNGTTLGEPFQWRFSTPPITIVNQAHSFRSDPLLPLVMLEFNIECDPQAVLAALRVRAGRMTTVAVRLATEAEQAADEQVVAWLEGRQAARCVVFRPKLPLSPNTLIQVQIPPAALKLGQGLLGLKKPYVYTLHTFKPLTVEDAAPKQERYAGNPLTFWFNNPIDQNTFSREQVTIDPPLADPDIEFDGDQRLIISGPTQANTTYRVTFAKEIKDQYGQVLKHDTTLTAQIEATRISSYPRFFAPRSRLTTLNPSSSRVAFTVHSVNHAQFHLSVYHVTPADWPDYLAYLQHSAEARREQAPPGKSIVNRTVSINTTGDELAETVIDLSDVVAQYGGHVILVMLPDDGISDTRGRWSNNRVYCTWLQVTQIGIDTFHAGPTLLLRATALRDGAPLGDAAVQYGDQHAVTNTDGLAALRLSEAESDGHLIVSSGTDTALFEDRSLGRGRRRNLPNTLLWHVLTDRQIYRAGEQVHVKGWIRRRIKQVGHDVRRLPAGHRVHYTVLGPQRNEIATGECLLSEACGFDFVIALPEKVNLGHATIQLRLSPTLDSDANNTDTHRFQIQAFRRPDVELTVLHHSRHPVLTGQMVQASVAATRFSGEAAANTAVNWTVRATPSRYFRPPNWSEFHFSEDQPWRGRHRWSGPSGDSSLVETIAGQTDSDGEHAIDIAFDFDKPSAPMRVEATATIQDVTRQHYESDTSFLVHACLLYVGLRSEQYLIKHGDPLEIEAIVTDIDGNPVAGHTIALVYERLDRRFRDGEWRQVALETVVIEPLISAETPVTLQLLPKAEGQYRVTATIIDAAGRQNRSQLTRRIGSWLARPESGIEQGKVTLHANQERFAVGDSAELLVEAPFLPAEGLLIIERGITFTKRRLQITEADNRITIPITAEDVPNIHVRLELVGATPRAGGGTQPAYASGQLTLKVPPHDRRLTVAVESPDTLMPGSETQVDVRVKRRDGTAVANAEVVVIVVDEAILALAPFFMLVDPTFTFYADLPSHMQAVYGRRSLLLDTPPEIPDEMPAAPMSMRRMSRASFKSAGSAPQPLYLRENFDALAAFVPNAITDEAGHVTVKFKLPDTLTRYRVMVMTAAGDNQFGSAETRLTATLPFTLRPAPPRFLNLGDQVELPIFVHNQTDAPLETHVAIEAHNLQLTDAVGKVVTVPSRDQIELRFPITTQRAGNATVRLVAQTPTHSDAVQRQLPVNTPATAEAFATYGVLEEGAIAQAVTTPADVFAQYGGLEIGSSSTAISSLTDALLFIVAHPYVERTDVLASRLLSIVALQDVLTAFSAEQMPDPDELAQAVNHAIEKLALRQTQSGTFPLYPRSDYNAPFVSLFAAHALVAARAKGAAIDKKVYDRTQKLLVNIDSHFDKDLPQAVRRGLRAYALHIRHLSGDTDARRAAALLDEISIKEHWLDTLAWLWPILAAGGYWYQRRSRTIERHVANRVVETAGAAHFVTQQYDSDYLLLRSNRRTDAFLLNALVEIRPNSDLIPKLVAGLLKHRARGRWRNLQENVFILLAIDKYFAMFESDVPNFDARFWLNEQLVGTHRYEGHSTDKHQTSVPIHYLTAASSEKPHSIIINKVGTGSLHYRLGLRYAPRELKLEAQQRGYSISRQYVGAENDDDVTRDADGRWHIKLGALVRVEVHFATVSRRIHTAMVDRLPAGLEPLNSALSLAEKPPANGTPLLFRQWWWRPWYDHHNMHDDRVEAFANLLWAGEYRHVYYARATTPGTFVVPPAKIEEIYSPEIFGRTATDIVIVTG